MRAMILAAGRGTRMRPLTDSVPKPLLRVGGHPLIVHAIEKLRAAGVREVVINTAWLGERIEQALGDGASLGVRIRYSREPAGALETAGGIRHALPLLGEAPFIVVSGDVFSDFDPATLPTLDDDADAHLVLVDNPPHHPDGDFPLIGDRVALDRTPRHTYAGIGVFRPALFDALTPGVRPLRPVLDAAIAAGRVSGQLYRGRWFDVGTPDRLAALGRLLS
jgi:MurNAc alpha-1-phosphate uridylyltransferase